MNIRLIAVAVATLAAAGCASSSFPTDPVVYSQSEAADSIKVRVGQTAVVEGIRVRFSAVDSDSRCASDVVCVWAGDAIASFIVEQNCECRSAAYDLKLHTTLQPKSGVAYGFKVELLLLSPAPRSTQALKQSDYSAWIRITRSG